jgi:hypothetical protein
MALASRRWSFLGGDLACLEVFVHSNQVSVGIGWPLVVHNCQACRHDIPEFVVLFHVLALSTRILSGMSVLCALSVLVVLALIPLGFAPVTFLFAALLRVYEFLFRIVM